MNFNFNPFPTLKTERLILRKLSCSDVDAIFKLRANKDVNRFITRKTPINKEDALTFINEILKQVNENKGIFWVIALKENNTLIGSIGLRNFHIAENYAEIGYDLMPNHQNKGIMSEALKTVLNFGFTKMNLTTLEAFTHKNNLASIVLLEKHQFLFQPEKRDLGFDNNRIWKLVVS